MTETGVPDAGIPAMAAPDYDAPGALSIVVQGALFQGNLVETANHCRHWRQLFPNAEIILALSLTDVVQGEVQDGVFTSLRLVPVHRHDGHLQAALGIIQASCDKVALAGHALPLPPIKSDTSKPNNANLQIAAAQRGLGLATGRHVLRMRADMVFMDRGFLDQYEAAGALPRGAAAVFEQRVLISWLYTLNPYTLERMPLHFSDWFHFGLLRDVRRIWQVPPMTLADGMHYRTHPHAPGSNARERLFNTRLAVEQHIIFNCFKADVPGLVLDRHDDRTSVTLAMDLLVDNFTICDLVAARCIFDKYSGEFTDHAKRFHCLTREDWLAMAQARGTDYRATLSHKIAEAGDEAAAQAGQGFPRTYEASRLMTRDGRLLNGEIVADPGGGMLFFGPYATLTAGRYMAVVNATTLEGPGTISLQVTLDAGERLLARRTLAIGAGPAPRLEIPFDVPAPNGVKMELVCGIKGLRGIAVSGITIRERLASEPLDAGQPKQGRPASRWFTRRKAPRA